MADIRSLVSQAKSSRLGKAIKGIASNLDRDKQQQGFQFTAPNSFARQGVQRVQQSFQQDPGQYSITRAFANIQPTAQRVLQPVIGQQRAQDVSFGLRGATQLTPFQAVNTLGFDTTGQQQFKATAPQTERQKQAQAVGRSVYGLALTAPIGGANLARNVAQRAAVSTGLGAGLGAGIAKLSGQDVVQGAKSGALQGFKQAPVLAVTNPLTERALGAIGYGGGLLGQAAQRFTGGAANLIEDEIISELDGLKPDNKQRALSFALGAITTGNTDLLKRQLRNRGVQPQQIERITSKVKQLRDEKGRYSKTGAKPRLFEPVGSEAYAPEKFVLQPRQDGTGLSLQEKAKTRLRPQEAAGFAAGFEEERDEQGNIVGVKYNPAKGLAGGLVYGGVRAVKNADLIKSSEMKPQETIDLASTLSPAKKRGFIKTVLKSSQASPSFKEAVSKIDPQNYQVEPNANALAFSQNLIKGKGIDTARDFVINSKRPDQNTVAVGLDLIREYQKQGNYDQAIEVLEKLDNQGREAGRLIQSLSLWNRLSPEGMLRFAQKTFDQANQRLTKFGKVELTPELAQQITERMNSLQRMADGPEKTKATKEVLDLISSKIPLGASELFDAYRYQNMLSGPQTQLRNIYGNFFQGAVLRPAQIPFEVVNDYVGAALSGRERTRYLSEVPEYTRKFWGSIPEATESFWQQMKGSEVDLKRLDYKDLKGKNIPQVLTVVPRFMQGMDGFFSTMIRNGETARLMKTGMNEKEALDEANRLAEKLLFRSQLDPSNKTEQGVILSKIDAVSAAIQKLGQEVPPVRWMIPFVSTPTNFLKQMVEYSPGLGLANLPGTGNKGNLIAKQMMGSMVALGGAQLAMSGRATWSAPTDPKEKELFYASGRKPFSIKVGDTWIPMSYFGPLSAALALPAAINHYQNESKTALTDSQLKKLAQIAQSSIEYISQQSFLSNVGSIVDIFKGDADRSIGGTLGFTAEQAIPLSGLIRYINKAIDPVYRKASGFKETIMKDIPGLSTQLEAYTLPDGSVSTRDPKNMFLPFEVGNAKSEYDLPLQQRKEYNQQRAVLNLAKKRLEEGKPFDGSEMAKVGGLTTTQTRDYIKEKVKLGFEVSDEELVDGYLSTQIALPKGNRYQQEIRKSKLFSSLSDVDSNEYLTEPQKETLKSRIAQEVGLTVDDLNRYSVARQDNNLKTMWAMDQYNSGTKDDFIRLLVQGRKPINGQILTSDGVVDNLVNEGLLPYELGQEMKRLDLNEDGTPKVAKKKGGSGKVKTVTPDFSALEKIKITAPKTTGIPRIKTSSLTFGGQ